MLLIRQEAVLAQKQPGRTKQWWCPQGFHHQQSSAGNRSDCGSLQSVRPTWSISCSVWDCNTLTHADGLRWPAQDWCSSREGLPTECVLNGQARQSQGGDVVDPTRSSAGPEATWENKAMVINLECLISDAGWQHPVPCIWAVVACTQLAFQEDQPATVALDPA